MVSILQVSHLTSLAIPKATTSEVEVAGMLLLRHQTLQSLME